MSQQAVFLNLFQVKEYSAALLQYQFESVQPITLNRQTKFRLAAEVARKLLREGDLAFSVGDSIYSTTELGHTGPFRQELDINGTTIAFETNLELVEKESELNAEKLSRLTNKLIDWYYTENVQPSFRMENVNYTGFNLFAKLQANLYRSYKININEGTLRATRTFDNAPYILLDTVYRVTWEDNLWEAVKAYVKVDLNTDFTLPSATTVRNINERFGRFDNKRGAKVQGKNKVGQYEVLEFDFSKNPTTPGTSSDSMSQLEYFRKRYGESTEITDLSQPLVKVRTISGYYRSSSASNWVYHVPELLLLDHLPYNIRSNTKVNSAIVNITKPLPRTRFSHILSFMKGDVFGKRAGFARSEFVRKFVSVDSQPVGGIALLMDSFKVKMGESVFSVSTESEFLSKILANSFHRVVNPKSIALLFSSAKRESVNSFYDKLRSAAQKVGLILPESPLILEVSDSKYDSFVKEAGKAKDCDLVMSFGSVGEDILYDSLKRRLLIDFGLLSQHVTYENTLEKLEELERQQNQKYAQSLLTMFSMQLCAKLGGAPWSFNDPIYEENCPIIGIDIVHNDDGSITGACAAFDAYGEYLFTSTTPVNVGSERAITSLAELIDGVLDKYSSTKGTPESVFVIRDGLNASQEKEFLLGQDGELSIIERSLESHGISDYILVMEKKGTHLRMYKKISDVKVENPDPGTVLVGKPLASNELLMVAQESYIGTVEPVLYQVFRPLAGYNLQRIAESLYKLSRHHWVTARSIKIPAPAYHADEITYLIRNVLGASPTDNRILSKPFYL